MGGNLEVTGNIGVTRDANGNILHDFFRYNEIVHDKLHSEGNAFEATLRCDGIITAMIRGSWTGNPKLTGLQSFNNDGTWNTIIVSNASIPSITFPVEACKPTRVESTLTGNSSSLRVRFTSFGMGSCTAVCP